MSVYLVGAKNPETRRQVEAQRAADPSFVVAGFIDNDPAKRDTVFLGLPVLGGMDVVRNLLLDDPDAKFVNLITGSSSARFEVSRQLANMGCAFTNLIHPDVDLRDVELGIGNYVQDHVIIQAGARIGNNVGLHFSSRISHETRIGHSAFVGPAALIAGEVVVGDGAFVGAHATIIPRLQIGRWATIGAGSVVVRDVPDYATVVGNPAKVIRTDPPVYTSGDITSV
jgi:sugar O-acyltransferase (sialic acid O-acetyltransferase NeuD family)